MRPEERQVAEPQVIVADPESLALTTEERNSPHQLSFTDTHIQGEFERKW
jgi:hypothetical protein